MVLIGTADHRVLVPSNILSNITNPVDLHVGPKGANYKEQIQWRDTATGQLLAASDFFSPRLVDMQVWAGYGGIIYEGLNYGHLMALKVLPTSSPSPSPSPSNSTSTNLTFYSYHFCCCISLKLVLTSPNSIAGVRPSTIDQPSFISVPSKRKMITPTVSNFLLVAGMPRNSLC
jgi:hypothetical protein